MSWLKKAAGITVGVAVGLLILNMGLKYLIPSARSYFGLAG